MKIIGFSIWGDNPMYLNGAIENIKLQRIHYPGWKCRFYIDKGNKAAKSIADSGGQVYEVDPDSAWGGLFWRFMALKDADVFLSRDCDSRLNEREAHAVQEWLNSPYKLHLMRDHFYHRSHYVLGGMWGAKKGFCPDFFPLMGAFLQANKGNLLNGSDQYFLNNIIWQKPAIRMDYMMHDDLVMETECHKVFKRKLPAGQFIGQQYDADNKPLVIPR